ncbi:MAG TPA: alkaline phosphatase family protein [Gemmatimonadaceae bacterium]|jgi:phospholipase C|nr:alkaline phosphatase family protein [Gemmatimonadaceae bacterium]
MRRGIVLIIFAAISACSADNGVTTPAPGTKIRHVIIIMQENRSFDTYFGTFPGADGIPMQDELPRDCLPDPVHNTCIYPYHDTADVNVGGPHAAPDAVADIDGGNMDGFVARALRVKATCVTAQDPSCHGGTDVMGYHDDHEIPNYWAYAQNFVLQDRLFEAAATWSLPAHLFMVSAWSASCEIDQPMTCRNALQSPAGGIPVGGAWIPAKSGAYAWTDITYLLHKAGISWKYYVANGSQPDCDDDGAKCPAVPQNSATPSIWNPLPSFTTVRIDGELGNIQDLENFYEDAKQSRLPQVAWIVPNQKDGEHPPAKVSDGEKYVTGVINAIMQSPQWDSTAIFLSWDDWGGFYDHVVPPKIDENGYGIRVPGLVISPYAKQGYIDHQLLSHDAYLKFIEDVFLANRRIDPRTDGRPDPRPTVRESVRLLGDLQNDFDFTQPPRAPMILPPR